RPLPGAGGTAWAEGFFLRKRLCLDFALHSPGRPPLLRREGDGDLEGPPPAAHRGFLELRSFQIRPENFRQGGGERRRRGSEIPCVLILQESQVRKEELASQMELSVPGGQSDLLVGLYLP